MSSDAFREGERVEWRCRECRRRVRLTVVNPDHADLLRVICERCSTLGRPVIMTAWRDVWSLTAASE